MNRLIQPGPRFGTMHVFSSKSAGIRLLIAAALTSSETVLEMEGLSDDILSAVRCLEALGAEIHTEVPGQVLISGTGLLFGCSGKAGCGPRMDGNELPPVLPCGESASTLRFLLPITAALGVRAVFIREGRLPERPIAPLDEVLTLHGAELVSEGKKLMISGQLRPGDYRIPGDISSQYVTGLLFALPLLPGDSTLEVTGAVESESYIQMTEQTLVCAGIEFEKTGRRYRISGGQQYRIPDYVRTEKDWSGAAFPLTLGAFSETGIRVPGLDPESKHGDRKILEYLSRMGAAVHISMEGITVRRAEMLSGIDIDASDVPDLVPALAVAAAAAKGETRIFHAGRLRLKESDRIHSVVRMLSALGADVRGTEDGMLIRGKRELDGGTVDPENDHRIAMAAAIAAAVCRHPVQIQHAECVRKSFPGFFDAFSQLEVEV